jgi:hypothetical protein
MFGRVEGQTLDGRASGGRDLCSVSRVDVRCVVGGTGERANAWTRRRVGGQACGRVEGEGGVNGRADGWMDIIVDGRTCGWKYVLVDQRLDGRMLG